MIRRGLGSVVAVLALTAIPGAIGQSSAGLKARLDTIVGAQAEVWQRYDKELEGKTTAEAQKPAVDRFHAETARNTEEVLALVLANPNDPAVVEALKFVIRTARAGPGDESYRAMEILLRDHVRDPGMGEICGRNLIFRSCPGRRVVAPRGAGEAPEPRRPGPGLPRAGEVSGVPGRDRAGDSQEAGEIDDWVHERHKETIETICEGVRPGGPGEAIRGRCSSGSSRSSPT